MAGEVNHELIYQTLLEIKGDIGALKSSQQTGNDRIKEIASSHYQLKTDYTKHKSKLLTISALLSGAIGLISTAIVSYFTGKTS